MALLMENREITDLKGIFSRRSREIIHCAGMREDLFASRGELAFLISTAMKAQYNFEAAVLFGTRSFISIFSATVSLFSALIMATTKCN